MTCQFVKLPDGGTAIVCFGRQRGKRCGCGASATLLCDWKMGERETCDRPICPACAEQVAESKHLCPEHRVAYRKWLAARQVAE